MSARSVIGLSVGAALALVVAYLAGRYSAPALVETRSLLDERLVSQAVTNAQAEWQRNVKTKTVTRTVYAGTGLPAERVTTIERDATSSGSSGSTTTTDTTADVHATTVTIKRTDLPGWRAGAAGWWRLDAPSLKPTSYSLELDRRLVGTLWLGARAKPDLSDWKRSEVGASISVEF